jgi:hypothetical protein
MNLGSKKFSERMNRIKKDWPEEFKEIKEMAPEYLQNMPNSRVKSYIEGFLQKKP